MLADRRPGANWALLAMACGLAGGAAAGPGDEAPPPDPALLEYLGSWDESDEEWLLVADDAAAGDENGDDADRDDTSRERDNEN